MLFPEFHGFAPHPLISAAVLLFFLHALASHCAELLLLPQNAVKLHIAATLCYTSAILSALEVLLQSAI